MRHKIDEGSYEFNLFLENEMQKTKSQCIEKIASKNFGEDFGEILAYACAENFRPAETLAWVLGFQTKELAALSGDFSVFSECVIVEMQLIDEIAAYEQIV